MSLHCPQCGKPNPSDFTFCLACGADLAAAKAAFQALADPDADALQATLPRVPPPPRTPSPRARGLIFAYTGAQSVKRILGGVFTCVGLGLTAVLGAGLVHDVAILAAGEPVQGKVIDVRPDTSVTVNGRHPYAIRFEHGGHQGSSSTLDLAWGSSLQPGQTIDVEAVPGWPAAARVKGTMASVIGWFALIPFIFVLIGVPFFVSAVRSNRREIRAFRFGTSTVGRVTTFGLDTSMRVNGRHPTVLRWEFEAGGSTYSGSLSHMDGHVLAPLVAGNKVAVVYDKDDPRANTLYVP